MKVAIVHDWLVGGGAERVVEEIHKLYPDAPIYTSYCTPEWRERLDGKVVTGWLQHLGRIRKFIPVLRIWWFTHLDFTGYDMVISSSGNGEAFGIKTPRDTLHVNYCHAPTHFYWRFYDKYLEQPGFGAFNPLARLGLKILVKPLRAWDYKAAQRANYFIANSNHIKDEIKEFYGRDSVVIFPPVNTYRFSKVTTKKRAGFVTASRQVPQKKLDIIIGAANELKLPLLVIGRGPEHERLASLAGDTVTLRNDVSDEEMPILFACAEAFLFAAYEDFGVTPVEALASGTPVLAYKLGGALDYIQPGVNGEFFNIQSVPSLCAAIQKFDLAKFSESAVRESAQKFSSQAFAASLTKYIQLITKGMS
ncbi:MAG: glycosyltransferase family 4 protein [Candidatus Saccharibacteria bacterium]|nr:glycosyltransferase family 4 protein [Candidatus Saccharibacteria bacterium]